MLRSFGVHKKLKLGSWSALLAGFEAVEGLRGTPLDISATRLIGAGALDDPVVCDLMDQVIANLTPRICRWRWRSLRCRSDPRYEKIKEQNIAKVKQALPRSVKCSAGLQTG